MADVGIGALHPQQVQHRGKEIRGIEYLVHLHRLQTRTPDEAGGPLQKQGLIHAAELQQGFLVLVAVGIVVGDADDHGVFQLSLYLQLPQEPVKEIVHQSGLQIGTVRFLIAGQAPVLGVLFQAPIAEYFVVLIA